MLMAVWKIAPALAAGNAVVLKPAEQSPLSAVHLARLFAEAGGPPGIFNVVNGPGETVGRALALHMDVAKVTFTGSTEVGKLMLQYAGLSNMKRVALECGGKTPQVFMSDLPDLATATKTAAFGIYGNMGEVCNAGSRLLVDKKIHDEFLYGFMRESESFVPGDPLLEETNMGPLVTFEQQKRVLGYIGIGKDDGASLAFGGNVPQGLESGAYVAPALFTGVTPGMRIAQEEIFGPVAAIIPVDGDRERDRGRQRHDLWLGGRHLDERPDHGASSGAGDRGRHGLGELFRRGRHDAALRRLQAVGQCAGQVLRQCAGLYAAEVDLG